MGHGAWRMVHGAWRMVYGAWRMVHGAWRMVHGAWCYEQRVISAEHRGKTIEKWLIVSTARHPAVGPGHQAQCPMLYALCPKL